MTAPPPLEGVSHVSLSVADIEPASRFWVDVMGFELVGAEPEFRFFFDRRSRVAVIVADHGGSVRGPFDERRAGLDHLALAVTDDGILRAWEQHLTECGVKHSGITPSDAGLHLNLRAPDDIPVELFVLGEELRVSLTGS